MSGLTNQLTPELAAQKFFQLFMSNQFAESYDCFTKKSQLVFIDWAFKHLKAQHPKAVEESGLGPKEVGIMFKRNDQSLVQSFWKHFYFASGAGELYQFGYFELIDTQGNTADVNVRLEYPNGQAGSVKLKMQKERNAWRFAYIESGLEF
jgi:hypothetical protein